MAFKLKSGNTTNFKSMGSSPVKQKKSQEQIEDSLGVTTNIKIPKVMKDDGGKDWENRHAVKSDAQKKVEAKKKEWLNMTPEERAKAQAAADAKRKAFEASPEYKKRKYKSPNKQRVVKGGEGQDQDKIFDAKGNHIGNWVNDKKVMFNDKPVKSDFRKDQPKHYHTRTKERIHPDDRPKKKSPTKQTDTTYADGSKKSQREQDFSKRHTAEKAKDKYWYKIDGKKATKEQYLKYENKPGNMEGGGKQTNNPDVYGRITSNHGRGPKTK